MAIRSHERIDIDECAREPIHIPGAIQPHGVLLIVDATDGRIVQASANAAEMFARSIEEILGAKWSDFVDVAPPPAELSARLATDGVKREHIAHLEAHVRAVTGAPRCDATWHLGASRWQLEIEPLLDARRIDHRDVHDLMRSLDGDHDVEAASSRIARGVRRLLGYDRVMIYRFDRDWHGEVVAEAVRHDLEPYLGLHYPSTDIPAQARALYLRNRVRTIGDIRYVPSPLVPTLDPVTLAPADLSDVALRSVSPVHLEYLGNMGVRATLVASIVVNENLWGLIACHHYEPRFPAPEGRDVADLVSRALAARIGSLERMRRAAFEDRFQTLREYLISHFAEMASMDIDELRHFAPELLEAVDADGVALISGSSVGRFGTLPNEDALIELRNRIVATQGEALLRDVAGVLHTDSLATAFPDLAAMAGLAAGVIYVPLDASSRSAILWTRVEQVRTVRWGGNPHLAKLEVIPGARLSPRQSFEAWQEDVRGHSLPWDPIHLEAARSLRVLVEVMDRKHFQAGFDMLHATLDALNQPMIVVAANRAGTGVELVHINQAFVDRTGAANPAAILAIWPIDNAATQRSFGTQQRVRVAPRHDASERRGLDLQPLGERNGRWHWLALLEF
jgi:light-regulated signal transduction histidine kinase (bacteriophytochrome)